MQLQTSKPGARFQIKELLDLFSFNAVAFDCEPPLLSINTDSRTIKEDQIFLPLSGEKFDGHDFINQILDKGNKGIKFSFCEKSKSQKVNDKHRSNLIVVENTLDAYHKIANYYRKKINPKVIAITGSSGKTTVKDLIGAVLSQKYKTHKTQSNFNNEFGVPKTILEMSEDTQALVLELAMRARGEIEYLAKTAEPDVAIITNIGTAHIGRLGTLQGIIEAKCEVFKYFKKDGIALIYNDPKLIEYMNGLQRRGELQCTPTTFDLSEAAQIKFNEGESFFKFKGEHYSVTALGKVHVLNSICAIKTAKYFGLSKDEIQKGLNAFQIPSGRGNVIKTDEDVYFVDESYNANPDSVKTAVSNLAECWDKSYKKILVLGELAELGEHENKLLEELGSWLRDKPLNTVITIGDKFRRDMPGYVFATNVKDIAECCDILKRLLTPKTVVLIKGSHVAGLEKVVKHFGSSENKN